MFINKLNGCEQQILMDLLTHIARCDNEFPEEEHSYIWGIRTKYNLKMSFEPEYTVEQLCSEITKDQSKIIILQELIRAAMIDGDFHDKEKEIVKKVADYFKIGYEKYTEVEDWVEKGMAWFKKGNEMIKSIEAYGL